MKLKSLRRMIGMLAVALTVALATRCDSTPTAPSTANVAGIWGGTRCGTSFITSCVITMTISQTDSSLTGTYGTTTASGTLTGTVSGSTVSLTMTPKDPQTSIWTVNLMANGDQMTGPFENGNVINLSRQSR